MSSQPSLIEINNQLYDANSGRLYHHPRGPVIDGFRRQARPAHVIKKLSAHRALKPARSVHGQTQRSKTLMRKVVNKPHKNAGDSQKSLINSSRAVNKTRVSRAMNMVKNPRVDRFGVPVKQTKALLTQAATQTRPAIARNGGFGIKSGTAVAIQPAPSMITSVSHQRLERMLDEALLRADSHKKALDNRHKSKRLFSRLNFMPKWLTLVLISLVLLSAGTYLAWRNIPYVSLKVASLKAQVRGSLPDYVPSGFRFAGPIEYKPGNISLTYKADGERYFTLEQQASNWNSSSLEANAMPQATKVQTSQVKGTTVYLDSSNNQAKWVSNGKLYTLKGELNADEVFKIANSIL